MYNFCQLQNCNIHHSNSEINQPSTTILKHLKPLNSKSLWGFFHSDLPPSWCFTFLVKQKKQNTEYKQKQRYILSITCKLSADNCKKMDAVP